MDDAQFSSESSRTAQNTDDYWIAGVRCGDKNSFKKMFEKYYEPLTRFAFRYLKSTEDAEGVVQDVFLWIWEKKENWHVEGTLKTYLFRAVKYKALDLLRHQEVKKKYIREHAVTQQAHTQHKTEFEKAEQDESFAEAVREAIEELPERSRLIYKMSRSEGLTYNEIAEILEISPKTVESQISRALDILRTRLLKLFGVLVMIKKVAGSFL